MCKKKFIFFEYNIKLWIKAIYQTLQKSYSLVFMYSLLSFVNGFDYIIHGQIYQNIEIWYHKFQIGKPLYEQVYLLYKCNSYI